MVTREDLDNFDESLDRRRRQSPPPSRRSEGQPVRRTESYPRRRPSTAAGRPVYRNASARRRREAQRKRRMRNRAIIVGAGLAILILIIVLFSTMIRGCSSGSGSKEKVSTDTIQQQSALNPATKDEAPAANTTAGNDLDPTYFKKPVIKDDNTNGVLYSAIYAWNRAGYELFGGDEERSKNYAAAINTMADKLPGIQVYDMVIPNHTEYGLPERLKSGDVVSTSQADSIKTMYASLNKNVKPINIYNYLADHNEEYIYFKSDHHWTGLGAYYAYKAFADTNALPALKLEDCTEKTIDGFTGTFMNLAEGALDSDTVHYWEFPYNVTMDLTYDGGATETYDSPYYQGASEGSLTYGVFIFGDNPLTVLKSQSENARKGKKLVIVKESYGNALAPYFTNNFEEVHVVDFRYFSSTVGKSLSSYCVEQGITDVLFANGIMSANTQVQLDSMTGLFN
ncbi:MAG: hypothetical protein IJ598_05670 [Ruminococcus sp.]|nr:hypothetical protein [Ruminococcus sp.]